MLTDIGRMSHGKVCGEKRDSSHDEDDASSPRVSIAYLRIAGQFRSTLSSCVEDSRDRETGELVEAIGGVTKTEGIEVGIY